MIDKVFLDHAKLYEMPENVDFLDITEKLSVKALNRRIVLFRYPSGPYMVKGLFSFVISYSPKPVLVYLRGGNKLFSIENPANDWTCCEDYTVLTTTYRGGVSEGVDEFGGSDLEDVKALIDFIPRLEKEFGVQIGNQKKTLIGSSRGGMQMFLALAKYPELQDRFEKIISLSGLLDMQDIFRTREDMVEMFEDEFGLVRGMNEEEWISQRNPILVASKIKKDLPIVIIQGTADAKTSQEQGLHMVEELQKNGCNVTYKEVSGGNHCLKNIPNRTQLVLEAGG